MPKLSVIIMGDIVKSGDRSAKSLMRAFRQSVKNINKQFDAAILSPLTITLGDEFQGVCKTTGDAIDIVIAMQKEQLRSPDGIQLRYVIHEGVIETAINTDDAYEMLGSGLTAARQMLNDKRRGLPKTKISLRNHKTSALVGNVFVILDDIRNNSWATNKAGGLKFASILEDFVVAKLANKEIAKNSGKDESQIWRFRNNWNIDAYNAALRILEKKLY